jgi:hypothetical protein
LQIAPFDAKCAELSILAVSAASFDQEEMCVDNKEYKVITSNLPAFGNPAKLRQIVAEESQAGWDLEEVIDSNKIRLSRDKSNRSGDGARALDPYRINVGMNQVAYLAIAALITMAVIYAIIQAAAMSVA